MNNKYPRNGVFAIIIGLAASVRGASQLLEVARNVDVLLLFAGGVAIGVGIWSLVIASRKS